MGLKQIEIAHPAAGENSPRLWSLPYVLTLVFTCVLSLTMTFFMPLLPIYIKAIGGNVSLAGLVVSIFTFVALFTRPLFATWIDRFGRKPVLVAGLALILLGCFSYSYITVIGGLLLIRVLHGLGYSAGTNANGTMVADVTPKPRFGEGFGYFGFATAASLALGPAIALLIMRNSSIHAAFLTAAVIAALGLAAAWLLSRETKAPAAPEKTAGEKALNQPARRQNPAAKTGLRFGYEKAALPASAVMLFVAFAYSGIVTFLPTYAGTLGIANISAYFLVYAAALLATRLIVDRVTKTRDLSVVLLPGIGFMIVAFILLALGKTLPVFLAAAVFYGIGYGAVQPTLNALVFAACSPAQRSAANSTFFSALDLGIGLGALVWGVVSSALGYPAIFFGCIVCMLLAAGACLLVFGKQPAGERGKNL